MRAGPRPPLLQTRTLPRFQERRSVVGKQNQIVFLAKKFGRYEASLFKLMNSKADMRFFRCRISVAKMRVFDGFLMDQN